MVKVRRSSSSIRRVRVARKARRMSRAKAARRGRAVALRKLFRTPKAYRKVRRCGKGKKRVGRVCKPAGHVKAVGSKAQVWKGLAKHTSGGLKKSDILRLTLTRGGKKVHRYVSAKKHAQGKRKASGSKALAMWRRALKMVTGGRIPKKGSADYAKAKELYKRMMKGVRSAGAKSSKSRSARKGGSAPARLGRSRRGRRGTKVARR